MALVSFAGSVDDMYFLSLSLDSIIVQMSSISFRKNLIVIVHEINCNCITFQTLNIKSPRSFNSIVFCQFRSISFILLSVRILPSEDAYYTKFGFFVKKHLLKYSPSDVLWGLQIFDRPIRFSCLAFIVYGLMYRAINRNRIGIWLSFAWIWNFRNTHALKEQFRKNYLQ